jgi:hypothetical protein
MQDAGSDTLSRYVPRGSVLAVEVHDFGALLDTWNTTPEKATWLSSDSYASFSRSKLFLRLKEAQGEFAAATSLPIDLAQLEAIAGGESVVALYDVGELRLLYVTELSRSIALETALRQSRLNLEPRRAANIDYWVHTDAESGRELAFTVADNRLFVATAATLLGQALELHANQGAGGLIDEPWYPAHGPRGDVRLIENLRTLLRSPHFRSYWIQGNITELSAYTSGVADLFLEPQGIRENRRLVRSSQADSVEESALAELTAIAPADAPLHRSWNNPTSDAVVDLLAQKLLSPGAGGGTTRSQTTAPRQHVIPRIGGDVEARIDMAPSTVSRSTLNRQPIQALIDGAALRGLLHVQSSTSGVGLVRYPSLVGVLAASAWNEAAALAAIQSSVQGTWSTSGIGTQWQSRGDHYGLAGLRDLFCAVRGDLLLVSDSEGLILAALANSASDQPTPDQAIYRARFRHASELDNYSRVMSHLDYLDGRNPLQTPRQPSLFTDTIGSLGGVLNGVDTIEIERFDRGAYIEESVLYRMP